MNQNKEGAFSFHDETPLDDKPETLHLIVKAFFNSTRTSIFLLAPDCKIIFLNKKARAGCQMIYGKDVNPGDNLNDLRIEHDESTFKLFSESFREALQGRPVMNEQQLQFPNTKAWIRMEYMPLFNENNVAGIVMRCTNIDERKEYEERIASQSEKLREISWTQSHKTRQPLASLLGLINILDKGSLTKENLEIVELLQVVARKLDKVISETVEQANTLDKVFGGSDEKNAS